ncbi:hypothetical protein D9M71_558110 [compost metagenome]
MFKRAEKLEVEIHLPIAWAIERATAGAGETTARDHAVVEQRQGGVWILPPHLREQLVPGVFGVAQHRLDKHQLQIFFRLDRWLRERAVQGVGGFEQSNVCWRVQCRIEPGAGQGDGGQPSGQCCPCKRAGILALACVVHVFAASCLVP